MRTEARVLRVKFPMHRQGPGKERCIGWSPLDEGSKPYFEAAHVIQAVRCRCVVCGVEEHLQGMMFTSVLVDQSDFDSYLVQYALAHRRCVPFVPGNEWFEPAPGSIKVEKRE